MDDSANEELCSDATANQGAIKALIERLELNEQDAIDIRAAADKLGLDAKKVKTIRKAKADALAAQKTLDALLVGEIIKPADVARVAPAAAKPAAAPKVAK